MESAAGLMDSGNGVSSSSKMLGGMLSLVTVLVSM